MKPLFPISFLFVFASITPPVKRLRAYQKKYLDPDSSRVVKFTIPIQDLSFVNKDLEWIVEPGDFTVKVGGLEESFTIKER